MEYSKPSLIYDQQAERLIKERGMVADKADLIRHLEDVGYYRQAGASGFSIKLKSSQKTTRSGWGLLKVGENAQFGNRG